MSAEMSDSGRAELTGIVEGYGWKRLAALRARDARGGSPIDEVAVSGVHVPGLNPGYRLDCPFSYRGDPRSGDDGFTGGLNISRRPVPFFDCQSGQFA